jgi:hypothetical protein
VGASHRVHPESHHVSVAQFSVRHKNMKTIAPFFLLSFLTGLSAFAEARSIVVWLDRPQQGPSKVSIYSDEKKEEKRNIDLAEAALVLEEAQGWGSGVSVFILSETAIETRDYLTLLEGMKENVWLYLRAIEVSHSRSFSDSASHLLKHFHDRSSIP